MLHDRKDTLKDFTAKIDYSVSDKTGGVTGKAGRWIFSLIWRRAENFRQISTVASWMRTGKKRCRKTTYSSSLTAGISRSRTWEWTARAAILRSTVLPPGAKPGDAVTLNGAITLPIGLDVEDVLRTFVVTMGESKDANRPVLKLVPRAKGKFDYTLLEVTVDKKMQLPVVLAQSAADGSVTTITLTEIKINSGGEDAGREHAGRTGWRRLRAGPNRGVGKGRGGKINFWRCVECSTGLRSSLAQTQQGAALVHQKCHHPRQAGHVDKHKRRPAPVAGFFASDGERAQALHAENHKDHEGDRDERRPDRCPARAVPAGQVSSRMAFLRALTDSSGSPTL